MNLPRFSSFATANTPEGSLGSRAGGSAQSHLQRGIPRTQARHCCSVTAKIEEESPSPSGSSGIQKSWPVEQRFNCGARREVYAGRDDVFGGRLGRGLFVGPVFWVA